MNALITASLLVMFCSGDTSRTSRKSSKDAVPMNVWRMEGAGGRAVMARVLVLCGGGFNGKAEGDSALVGVGGALRL